MPFKSTYTFLLGLCLTAASLPSFATVSIQNLSALRSYAYTTGNEFVYVRGYSVVDDGGQGFFAWDSASTQSDNDGTVIQVSGVGTGRWMRVYTVPCLSSGLAQKETASPTTSLPSLTHCRRL